MKTISVKVERMISAAPNEVYAAWLDRKVPGTPWNMGEKLLLTPKVDGFFYWLVHETPHYGRFTELKKGSKIQHTWMSPYTNGLESTVTVTFRKQGDETVMTLVHSGLPNNSGGKAHEDGWNRFMDSFPAYFKR
ncbi:MAG TPA: SRPBCC domain-containing protein [Candidatus Didemnitutus sp.]|nr:SRPBCC domain-containing protein [Candidatus Didemnitutus sp.]